MFVFVNVAPRALALQSPQTDFVGVDTAQDDSEENRTSEESNGFLAHHLTTRSRFPLKLWHPAKVSTCGCAGHKKIALREVARDRGFSPELRQPGFEPGGRVTSMAKMNSTTRRLLQL